MQPSTTAIQCSHPMQPSDDEEPSPADLHPAPKLDEDLQLKSPEQRFLNSFHLQSLSSVQLEQISPSALAYLGDAVYELYIRCCYLGPPKRIQIYHHQVVAQVRAEAQANHLRSLLPHLTPAELTILKRGRNAASGHPRRIDLETYRQATSLETLVGYLYLTDPERLMDILSQLELESIKEP